MLETRQPMKPFNTIKNILAVAAMVSALTWQASAVIVYTSTTTAGNQGANGPWALGLDFTVNTGGYVTRIGAFDSGSDGFGSATIPVAIYNLGNSTIVPGTSVSFTGMAGTPDGGAYRFLSIGSVYLAPGSYSIVAANYGVGGEQNYNAYVGSGLNWPDGGFVNPIGFNTAGGALTMGPGRFASGFSTLTLPAGQGDFFQPLFGSASFDFAVPEASQFAMAGIGLLGLVYIGRAYVLRTKHA